MESKKVNFSRPFCTLIFILSFSLLNLEVLKAKVIVISDIDDTIKISEVSSPLRMVFNYLNGAESFPHLIKIYHDLQEKP